MRTATLAVQAREGAQRDQELAAAVDDLREQADAERRGWPQLPGPLKELFLPTETNESPISIYGQLIGNYNKFTNSRGAGEFEFQEFDTYFLLQLNQWILLETELEFMLGGVEVGQAQADFILSDCLTAVAGRFRVPIGYFNERAHPAWINKLPDFPLMFRTVSPADFSLNGIQLRGAKYIGCWPIKLEYSAYLANGLGLPDDAPPLIDPAVPPEMPPAPMGLADLNMLKETSSGVNHAMAYGGRLGFWLTELGLNGGFSVFFNTPYTDDAGTDIELYQVDFGYHKGNWDLRCEFAQMFQDTQLFIGRRIERRGLYAQIAYRPRDAANRFLQNVEGVFRYGYTSFKGIDPATLDFSSFDSPVDAPVNRNQYTFGVNYYLYPSLLLKLAYEINAETGDLNLHDNVFLAQLAWGF